MAIKKMKSQVIAKVPEALYIWLGQLADKLEISRGELIRRSINFYLLHLKSQGEDGGELEFNG